ncbi:MAG: oxidoreductase [Betaproteobacteria bacterium RIFCSPLOWO2_02_FULL_64_12]|nr:MAG: oxidoreductase [Betaproteobacteria bacterium RIFCSPLOWO2_02_FULL_64_12]
MAKLIKYRAIATDSWQLLEPGAEGALPPLPLAGDVIVPLALWRARREALAERSGKLGVWLDSHEDPADIAAELGRFAVVAVNFPKFGDGRGFSTARLLRERYGYRGELRAVGEVLRDQLLFMARCGFDAFLLREDQDAEEALSAFDDFSDGYQGWVEQPQPLFRRRLEGRCA